MTGSKAGKKEKGRFEEAAALLVSVGFTAIIFLAAILLSDELAEYVAKGLSISARVIIPSIFPFLILSDLAVRYIHLERVGFLRRIFERLFRINGAALPVFVCGALCGFPVGARLAILMYDDGKISKCECERLIAFSNNASPGYVICAVGVGMLGNLHDGILLYAAMILSSIFFQISKYFFKRIADHLCGDPFEEKAHHQYPTAKPASRIRLVRIRFSSWNLPLQRNQSP